MHVIAYTVSPSPSPLKQSFMNHIKVQFVLVATGICSHIKAFFRMLCLVLKCSWHLCFYPHKTTLQFFPPLALSFSFLLHIIISSNVCTQYDSNFVLFVWPVNLGNPRHKAKHLFTIKSTQQ